MIRNIKKLSALIIATVLMTESVSAAGINSLINIANVTGDFVKSSAIGFVNAIDEVTSAMAISDMITSGGADEVVSGQATLSEDANYILLHNSVYSKLNNVEKRILNYEYGVREDTMSLLQDKGYTLRESISTALVMQRMNLDISHTERMFAKLGEDVALSQSLKFKELQTIYGGWDDYEVTSENIAELMADGYDSAEAVQLFILSQCIDKPVDEITDDVVENYIQTNELSEDDISDITASKADELGLSSTIATLSSDTETDSDEDSNKLKGPFVAASDINDSINYTNGSVIYNEKILSLPGVNGLDLDVNLQYDSSNRYRYDDTKSLYYNDSELWNLGFTRLTNDLGGDIKNKKISRIRLADGSVYDLESKDGGKSYILKQAAYDTIKVYKDGDNSFTTQSGNKSTYYAEYLDGKREYFDSTGAYIGTQDRFGNKIIVDINNDTTTITDSVGREVVITYDENDDSRTITFEAPNGAKTVLTFAKYYMYTNKEKQMYAWYLTKKTQYVRDITGDTSLDTTYSYDMSRTMYEPLRSTTYKKYREFLLTSVTYPTGMSLNYEYAEDERGKTPGWKEGNGTSASKCLYSRITRRYYRVDGKEKDNATYEYTDTNYTGYTPDNYREPDGGYTFGMTINECNGLSTEYTFDKNALNTKIEGTDSDSDKNKYTQTMEYVPSNKKCDGEYIYGPNPSVITLQTGDRTKSQKCTYNDNGLLWKYLGPLAFEKNADKDEYTIEYSYNKYGLLSSKTYKQNATQTIEENNSFCNNECSIDTNEINVNGTLSAKTEYTYPNNSKGDPESVKEYTDESNFVETDYSYYGNGMLKSTTRVVDPKNSVKSITSYEYDSMGNVTKQIDGNGGETKFEYDLIGNLSSKTSPEGNKDSYKYNYKSNDISYIDPNGTETVYDYDPAGNLLTVKSGNDTLASYTYNNRMLCDSETVGKSITRYEYDCADRKSSVKIQDTSSNDYHIENYEYAYADISTPTRKTIKNKNYRGDENDITEEVKLNNCGWVTEKRENDKKPVYKYEYDYLGNPTTVMVNTAIPSSPVYATTTYTYNYAGKPVQETDSYNNYIYHAYDWLGREKSKRDKNGNLSFWVYDGMNNLKSQSLPLSGSLQRKTEYWYDKNGNRIEELVHCNSGDDGSTVYNSTKYSYDKDNRLTKTTSVDTDKKQYYTEYEYDNNGNKITVKGANGKNVISYQYDKYNRVTQMTDPMGYNETYRYDIAGNMISKVDRNGNTISYTYDVANRLTEEKSGNVVRAQYTYDLAGNKIIEKNNNGVVKNLYDEYNTLYSSRVYKDNQSTAYRELWYTYDARKNVTERKVRSDDGNNEKDIQVYDYTYDDNNNMTAVKNSFASDAHVYAAYTYDANGNLLTENIDNNLTTIYEYNGANLITHKTNSNTKEKLTEYTNDYYTDGNLKSTQFFLLGYPLKSINYKYDGLGRLTSEESKRNNVTDTIGYSYDVAGNRSMLTVTGTDNYTTAYTYDKNNRLMQEKKTSVGSNISELTKYTYDKNGNTLLKQSGSVNKNHVSGESSFGIYFESELPYTYEKNTYNVFNQLVGTQKQDGTTATYTYYPNNLRYSKSVTKNGKTTYTGFLWDGSQTVAEFDSNFNITQAYMFGAGQRRVMGTNLSTNAKTYYMYNTHGDVQCLMNSNGGITHPYEYDAFGNELNPSANDTNPWRYCGEYYDSETGSIYLRNRYYNPVTGSFITEDPIRSGGNWYSYCGGNPVRYLDPSGKSILDTIEGQGSSLFEEFIVPIILKMEPDWSTVNNYYDNSQLNLPRYINNQNSSVIKAARFGGYDLSYNGCEIIAIYNTMEKIRKPQKLCDIISYFENNALGLHSPNAMWGILPERDDMDNYFEQMGCDVEKVNKLDKVDELKENYDAIIVSYWNSSKDKKKGIHTVAVLKLREYQDTWCVLNGTSEGTTSISSIQDFINEKDQSGDKKKFINARGVKLKEGT